MNGPPQHLLDEGVGDEYVQEHEDRGNNALGPEIEDIQNVRRCGVAQLWLASERKCWLLVTTSIEMIYWYEHA